MLNLDAIKSFNTAHKTKQMTALVLGGKENYEHYIIHDNSAHVIDALIAEVEGLQQAAHPEPPILECACGHPTETHVPYVWVCAKGCYCDELAVGNLALA